jgi:uncharacterized protein (DUF1697 family)
VARVQSDVQVALLRGINVGGKNILPMKTLVSIFEDAGCKQVRTYIQSGNVLFRTSAARVEKVLGVVTAAVSRRLGKPIPIVTRSAAQLQSVVQHNPFLSPGIDVGSLHVAFLAKRPGKAAIDSLDPERSPPDEFVVRGREIYVRFPNGVARSRLTNAYFDKRLTTTSTVRNWRTVLKLVEWIED